MECGINNESKILSITIPTWNRANTLSKALECLLPQIESVSNRVELIISDNCSTDNTTEVVDSFKSEYCNIKIIYNKNDKNLGFYGNFKKCRELSSGEYIWLLSDDDFICKGVLNEVVLKIENNKELAFVYLKNNVSLNNFNYYESDKNKVILNENYEIGLISSVIFYNNKANDELLFKEYFNSAFIGFIFLLNSFNFKENVEIIEGYCLKAANDTPMGYNYFDVFVNHMDHVFNYLKKIKVKNSTLYHFKKVYLLNFLRPNYIRFKSNGIVIEGLSVSNVKKINFDIFVKFHDIIEFWILFFPLMFTNKKSIKFIMSIYKNRLRHAAK